MSFTAKITADITKFEQNIGKAIDSTSKLENTVSAKLSKMGDSFVKIGARASVLSAAIAGATVGLVKMGISAGNASAEINNLSTATSLSTDVIQELSYVATASNSSFEGLQRSMDSFQRRLKTVGEEGSRVNEMFGRLGVSTTDASGNVKSMDDVLLDTFNKLGDMEEGLAKNAIGAELFGRSWNEVSLIVSSGSKGIAELREEAHKLGLVLDENTLQSSDDFATAMELVGFQIDKLKTKVGASLVPILQESVLPLLQDKIIPAVSRFAGHIAQLSERFNALSPSTKNAIFALGGIAAAAGPLLLSLGGLLKILPLIATGFTAVTGPIGIAIAAIAGAAVLVVKNWDSIKEYFTSGGGAELFNTIKSIAVDIKDFFVNSWNDIKDLGITIWNAIGSDVINIVKNVFSNITSILTVLVKTFRNVAQILHGIFTLDFKFALDGLKNLFLDIFKGLTDIAFNALSTVSGLLSTFFDWVGLDKWAASVNNFSNKIAEMVRPSAQATDAIEEVGESADKTKTSVDNLATSFKELGEAQEAATAKIAPDDVTGASVLAPVIEPTIDAQGLKEKLRDTTYGALADLGEGIKVLTIDLSSMLSGALTDVFGSVADAMMNGDNMMAALGASLLGTLGGIMVQLGQMVIATGSAIEAVKVALSSLGGIGAIAAGVALIAIGSLFRSGASKLSRSMGSGGGYSSAPSMNNTSPSYGPSEYRGAYQDDFVVTFVQKGDELIGVLDTAQQRRRRI